MPYTIQRVYKTLVRSDTFSTLETFSDLSSVSDLCLLESVLRVRSQDDSLSRQGLAPKDGGSDQRHRVCFDVVEIREYPVVLGCHPNVVCGPAVELDWKAVRSFEKPLDVFENSRKPRRSLFLLRLSTKERERILSDGGYAEREFQLANQRAELIRQSRDESSRETSNLKALIKASQKKRELLRASRKGLFGRLRSRTSSNTVGASCAVA